MTRDCLRAPVFLGCLRGSAGKESARNVGDLGSTPGLGSSPGEGKSYLLQYSGLEVTELDRTEQLSLSLSTTLRLWGQ